MFYLSVRNRQFNFRCFLPCWTETSCVFNMLSLRGSVFQDRRRLQLSLNPCRMKARDVSGCMGLLLNVFVCPLQY